MSQQIAIDPSALVARALGDVSESGTREILPDLAYLRLIMVNVVFVGKPRAGDRQWVLVDAGLPATKSLIQRAAAARFGEGSRPAAIVMTHGHFDHVGALESLAEAWDVPVYAHALERPYLDGTAAYPPGDPKVGGGLMATLSPFYPTRPVDVGSRLTTLPDDGSVPPMPGWRWVHTPGHSPGHVSFFRDGDAALIVGDAFITVAGESAYATALQTPEVHGPPKYFTIDWDAARASVKALAALEPSVAISGHGQPLQGPELHRGLDALAGEFDKVAKPSAGRYVEHSAKADDGSAYRKV